ncbi:MAG TPA: carboxymuconolactone decarboxylase family protein [Planctomycetota bacterium]
MTWIKTLPLSTAQGALKEAVEAQRRYYPPEYAQPVPGLPEKDGEGIVAAHSLIPEALRHAFSTFGALMDPALPLSRRRQELIAAAVSTANQTAYCSLSHVHFLKCAGGDMAALDEVDRLLVDYATQVTRDATKIGPEHHAKLRAAGFDDRGILQITLIAAWFNYINRVADALGVGRS